MDYKSYLISRNINVAEIRDDEIKINCPFHDDHNASASFNTTKEVFNCLAGCGGMGLIQLEMRMTNASYDDARLEIEILKGNISIVPDSEVNDAHKILLQRDDIILKLQQFKGISSDSIKKFQLGWNEDEKRLWIPCRVGSHYHGLFKYDVFGYTKNSAKPTKVLQYKRGVVYRGLFPHSIGATKEFKTLLVVEGLADSITCNGLGIPTVTAGSVSQDLTKHFDAFKDRDIILCFDNDGPGREGMKAQASALADVGIKVRMLWISEYGAPEGYDINDCIVKLGWNSDNILAAMAQSKLFVNDHVVEPLQEIHAVTPINFGAYPRAQYGGQVVSFLATLEGKSKEAKHIPNEVDIICHKNKGAKCVKCPAFKASRLQILPEINRTAFINFYFSGSIKDRENIALYFGLNCKDFKMDEDRITTSLLQQIKLGPHENIEVTTDIDSALAFTDKIDLPFNRIYTVRAIPIRHPRTNAVILLINDIQEADEELFYLSDDTKEMLKAFQEE